MCLLTKSPTNEQMCVFVEAEQKHDTFLCFYKLESNTNMKSFIDRLQNAPAVNQREILQCGQRILMAPTSTHPQCWIQFYLTELLRHTLCQHYNSSTCFTCLLSICTPEEKRKAPTAQIYKGFMKFHPTITCLPSTVCC